MTFRYLELLIIFLIKLNYISSLYIAKPCLIGHGLLCIAHEGCLYVIKNTVKSVIL